MDKEETDFKMLRMLLLAAAVYGSVASGQPVSCNEDAQCPDNSYCATDNIRICLECLSCESLKREPPFINNVCIKSVADCGSCYEGLVADRHGDVNSACVPPDTSQLSPTPSYLWPLVGVLLAVVIAVVIIIGVLYICRHEEFFKPVGSSPSVTAVIATAPEAPPPYNPGPYVPVRTESPYPAPPYAVPETINEEDERPFIKRAPPSRPQDARESAGSQAARPYNRPNYERHDREGSPIPEFPPEESNDPLDNFPNIHEEETEASTWTPDTTTYITNGDANANGVLSVPALLAAARETTLLDPSPAKKKRVAQDTNNNRNQTSGQSSQSFTQLPQPSHGGVTLVAQINNVLQIHKGN